MSNTIRYIILGVFIAIAIAVVLAWGGIIPGLSVGGTAVIKKTTMTMWGTVDDEAVITGLTNLFQSSNPGVKIIYTKKDAGTYEQELIRAFAAGKGPDLFSVHNTWLHAYGDLLFPSPAHLFSANDIKSFLEVVLADFMAGGALYAIPLYVDTLALYYNADLFNSAGIVYPPADWDAFVKASRALTRRKQSGDILVSGAALGGGKNIAHAADILTLLMLQYGSSIVDAGGRVSFGRVSASSANVEEAALNFYTSFARQASPTYSWSHDFVFNSEDMFAQNKVGMLFGYADTKVRLQKKSPYVRFSIAPAPQIKNSVFNKNYANYWGYGVYKNSPNRDVAWQFLKFLTMPTTQDYYTASTQRAGSQRSAIAKQQHNPDIGVFADQALTARSVNQISTHILQNAFLAMIESQASSGQSAKQALQNAADAINALIKPKNL